MGRLLPCEMSARWRVDFSSLLPSASVADPPGYDPALCGSALAVEEASGAGVLKRRELEVVQKQAQAWALAKSPAGQLPMMFFMMWMSGTGVQIFSIMITFTNVANPVRAILGSGASFARLADPAVDTRLPRLLFVALHCATMLYALSKLEKMGLLPTHASDWVPNSPPLPPLETASAGLPIMR